MKEGPKWKRKGRSTGCPGKGAIQGRYGEFRADLRGMSEVAVK